MRVASKRARGGFGHRECSHQHFCTSRMPPQEGDKVGGHRGLVFWEARGCSVASATGRWAGAYILLRRGHCYYEYHPTDQTVFLLPSMGLTSNPSC